MGLELAGFAFTEPGEVANLVTPLLARRIAACLSAAATGTVGVQQGVEITVGLGGCAVCGEAAGASQ